MWSYGIQLWGIAAKSHTEIFPRFQSKTLRMIANAAYYMTNRQIHRVEKEIRSTVTKYYNRILQHPNVLANNLLKPSTRFSRLRSIRSVVIIQINM